jgi:SOS-response transcriptional repressor LexA
VVRTRLLAEIEAHQRSKGYPPTRQELAKALGLTSTSTIHHHLWVLAVQGQLRIVEGIARGLVPRELPAVARRAGSYSSWPLPGKPIVGRQSRRPLDACGLANWRWTTSTGSTRRIQPQVARAAPGLSSLNGWRYRLLHQATDFLVS